MTPNHTRRQVLRRGAATGAVALAGCLDSLGTGTDVPAARETTDGLPGQESVGMACHGRGENEEYYFSPSLVWVRKGATVTWTSASTCRQTCTAYHPEYDRPLRIPEDAAPWQGPDSRDGSVSNTFAVEGVYDYFGLYEEFGQVGSVVVGHPNLEDQPGLTEPGDDLPEKAQVKLRTLNEQTRELLG